MWDGHVTLGQGQGTGVAEVACLPEPPGLEGPSSAPRLLFQAPALCGSRSWGQIPPACSLSVGPTHPTFRVSPRLTWQAAISHQSSSVPGPWPSCFLCPGMHMAHCPSLASFGSTLRHPLTSSNIADSPPCSSRLWFTPWGRDSTCSSFLPATGGARGLLPGSFPRR